MPGGEGKERGTGQQNEAAVCTDRRREPKLGRRRLISAQEGDIGPGL